MTLSPCPKCGAEKGRLRWSLWFGHEGVVWWVECHPGDDKPGHCRFADETSRTSQRAIAHWNNLERQQVLAEKPPEPEPDSPFTVWSE